MATHLAFGLGSDVIALPRGALGLNRREDVGGDRGRIRQRRDWTSLPGKDPTQGQVQVLRAEKIGRLGPPARALFCEGAWRMLVLSGVEGRLLRELLRLDRGRRSPVVGLELQPKRSERGLDVGASRGPDARSSASMPTISRTARLSPLPPSRSSNRTQSRSVSSVSRRVLYRSEAATLFLNNARPSSDNQLPSRVQTLFDTATWVCRSGSPARESRWVNAAR